MGGGQAEVRGSRAVAESFAGRARAARRALVNGAPGAVWSVGGTPKVVFDFTIADGKDRRHRPDRRPRDDRRARADGPRAPEARARGSRSDANGPARCGPARSMTLPLELSASIEASSGRPTGTREVGELVGFCRLPGIRAGARDPGPRGTAQQPVTSRVSSCFGKDHPLSPVPPMVRQNPPEGNQTRVNDPQRVRRLPASVGRSRSARGGRGEIRRLTAIWIAPISVSIRVRSRASTARGSDRGRSRARTGRRRPRGVAGRLVHQQLRGPQVHARQVDLGHGAVRQLEVELETSGLDRRVPGRRSPRARTTPASARSACVHPRLDQPGHVAASVGLPRRPPCRESSPTAAFQSPDPAASKTSSAPSDMVVSSAGERLRRARRSARRARAPRRRRRRPCRTRRTRGRRSSRSVVPSLCSSSARSPPSIGPSGPSRVCVDRAHGDLLEDEARRVLGAVHVADLRIAGHDHRGGTVAAGEPRALGDDDGAVAEVERRPRRSTRRTRRRPARSSRTRPPRCGRRGTRCTGRRASRPAAPPTR